MIIKVKSKNEKVKTIIKKSKVLNFDLWFCLFTFAFLLNAPTACFAEEEVLSPKDMIVRAWEAWGTKNLEKTFYWTDKCIGEYSE